MVLRIHCLHSMPLTLHQATAAPRLCCRLLDTQRQVWVSLLWGHCLFLLSPGACKGFVCALQECVSQSCVSSGGSTIGLMVTSSKRAYAIPRSTAPGAPAPTAVHCLPISTGDTHTQFSLSLCGVSGSQRVQGHFSFLVGMGFDSKCDFATPPPTPSSLWGFSFAFGSRLSPQSHSSTTQPPLKLLFHVKLQGL